MGDILTEFKQYMKRDLSAPEQMRREKIKRGQESFREYCNLINPTFFKANREYQDEICDNLQAFYENKLVNPGTNKPYDIMIINLPPGFGKSYTASLFATWIYGKNIQNQVIEVSYNQSLSIQFSTHHERQSHTAMKIEGEVIARAKKGYNERKQDKSGCTLEDIAPRFSTWIYCPRAHTVVASWYFHQDSTSSKVQISLGNDLLNTCKRGVRMKDLLTCCMGLDIHKDTIVACLLVGETDIKPTSEIRTFSTLIPGMQELRNWVEETQCKHIAMESTGIYWQPIYETLEDCFNSEISLLVVNARHMKNVPGKKTDMRDSEWIATLLRAGLLNGSFIPEKEIRELRHLTRYRKSIVRDVTSQKNRIEKFLQSSGFRLSSFISDVFGASGRNILRHLMQHGVITMEALDTCLKTQTRKNIKEIMVSVNGTLSVHQRGFLKMMFTQLEQLEKHRKEVETAILSAVEKFSEAMDLLCSIPGIDKTAASAIIAEIGTDMSKFHTAEHISSWAGLAPGNHESAGKKKAASITKGNPYIKSMLCEVSWVVAGKRNTYLSGWYWRIKQQKGAKRATIALARKTLVIIYTMLKSKRLYDESSFEQRRQKCLQKRTSKFIGELTRLGYHVEYNAG